MSIRIGILGYGNLGKGVECAVKQNTDTVLKAVFTRRDPNTITPLTEGVKVCHISEIENYKNEIDVLILCGGSATDLPIQTPQYAKHFNVIDSFDTHANINEHFENVNKSAKECNHVAVIACGWDPGMFSLNRLYANCVLPNGCDYTFWGKGVSQGHSDAIRRIDGVADAKQYTIPKEDALAAVRSRLSPKLTTRDKHLRECFVVVKEGADKDRIKEEIVNMPNYFADYDTIVHFVSQEELNKEHNAMPHGGFVFRYAKTGWNNENTSLIEYNLKLDSNPEFTANVLLAYARAAYRLSNEGNYGCKTVLDIPPKYLSSDNDENLRKMFV